MKGLKKAGCLLLVLLTLLPAGALGGTIEQLITTLAAPAEQPVEIRLSGTADKASPLSGERIEWLNRLLKHLSLRARIGNGTDEISLEADGETVFTVTRREGENGEEVRFSFDSGTIWRTDGGTDVLSDLSGVVPEENPAEYYAGILRLTDGFYAFFEGLPEAFPEYAAMTKSGKKFKGYGQAAQRWSITIPEEAMTSEKMAAYIAAADEPVRRFLAGVTFSGRQRFTLLRDADGRLMKVNYTGTSGTAASGMRRTDLDWQCLRKEGASRDVLKLKTPAVSGSGRNNITLERETAEAEDGTEQYTCDIETDKVEQRVRTLIRLKIRLTAEGKKITGEIQETRASGGHKADDRILVEAAQADAGEYSGSIEIIRNLDKIEGEHFRIGFTAGPCETPEWPEGTAAIAGAAQMEEIRTRMAAAFVRACIRIPEEDLQYLLADLPAGWWAQMKRNIQNTEGTEVP